MLMEIFVGCLVGVSLFLSSCTGSSNYFGNSMMTPCCWPKKYMHTDKLATSDPGSFCFLFLYPVYHLESFEMWSSHKCAQFFQMKLRIATAVAKDILFSHKKSTFKLTKIRLELSDYDFEIVYKKGPLNTNADVKNIFTNAY